MRRLFKLEPIGIGTADVESLASYFHRLAIQHGVSIGRLLGYLELFQKIGSEKEKKRLISISIHRLVRPNDTNELLVETLNAATNVGDLRKLCLLFLHRKGLSSFAPYLFSNTIRWCPACFEEFRLAGLDGYYKLIWHIGLVHWCLVHRVPLEARCRHCGSDQTTGDRKYAAIFCQKCGGSLARVPGIDEIEGASWDQPYADIEQFIRDIPELVDQSHIVDPVESIRELLKSYSFVDDTGVFKDPDLLTELIGVIYKNRSVSIRLIRRLAHEEGLPISAFFLEGGIENSRGFEFMDSGRLPNQDVYKKRKIDHEEAYRKILEVVELSDDALSVRGLARQVGVSKGYIESHFPHLSNEMVERRRNALAKRKTENRKFAEAEALRVLRAQLAKGQCSQKAAYQELVGSTDLPKNMLREVISIIFRNFENTV